ncbi:MAG: sugar phosphate nucleotidyltransferase, partial [Candidatus Hydrogenedentes bacterium]|nr:sugar phosphate nucleotidyltransferase [Candidatus Hydrogenedentota bacterium]
MKDVVAVLLAGGAGERLHPLTRNRAKPAVPFGGIYRIIDVTLSNCLNSNCRRILVLVQYKSHSLARHMQAAWNVFRPEFDEFIDIIPPQQRVNSNWYLGTADAIYQNLYFIQQENPREVLILSGDHIYKMDYMKMLQFHRGSSADLTIAAIETPVAEASRFGVLETDADGRVVGFEEKPESPKPLPSKPDSAYVSMGIYVFNTDILKQVAIADSERTGSSHDFGKDIIPRMIHTHKVCAYRFIDENKEGTHKEVQYWRDVGTIDAYWEANMDLV